VVAEKKLKDTDIASMSDRLSIGPKFMRPTCRAAATATGAVPANQPVSGGEATDRRKSFRRKMADCPS